MDMKGGREIAVNVENCQSIRIMIPFIMMQTHHIDMGTRLR